MLFLCLDVFYMDHYLMRMLTSCLGCSLSLILIHHHIFSHQVCYVHNVYNTHDSPGTLEFVRCVNTNVFS